MVKNKRAPLVVKTSGEREAFSEDKLRISLLRSGADIVLAEEVLLHIASEVRDEIPTTEIYRHAFAILKKKRNEVAARYSLRRAVLDLGPSGFPFEKFIAEILRKKGYTAKTGVILPGFCVSHEVDVFAEKGNRHIFVEAKFHNQLGIKSDVKVALYVHARFLDLQKWHTARGGETQAPKIHEGWLVTNTKLTSDAIAYAQCAGLTIIGWDYPHGGDLQDLIMETKVHPLTCLTTLSSANKTNLLNKGIVMCTELRNKNSEMKELGLSPEKIKGVIDEVNAVCREF